MCPLCSTWTEGLLVNQWKALTLTVTSKIVRELCTVMPVFIIIPLGLMKTLHLVTVKWAHVEDTVRRETLCLCQACFFDLIPLWKIINHTVFCSSKCRSCSGDKMTVQSHPKVKEHFLLKVWIFSNFQLHVMRSRQFCSSVEQVSIKLIWSEKTWNASKFFFQHRYNQLNLVKKSLRHLNTQTAYVSNVQMPFSVWTMKRRVNNMLECGNAKQSLSE